MVKLQNPRGSHDDLATAVGMAVVHLGDHPTNLQGKFYGLLQAQVSLTRGGYLW